MVTNSGNITGQCSWAFCQHKKILLGHVQVFLIPHMKVLFWCETFYASLSSCYFPLFHTAIMKIIKRKIKSKLTCNSTKNIKQYIISHPLLDKTHQAFSQVSCSCLAFSVLQRPCKGCHLPWPRRSVRHHQEYRP